MTTYFLLHLFPSLATLRITPHFHRSLYFNYYTYRTAITTERNDPMRYFHT
jgi:hypothetical protein